MQQSPPPTSTDQLAFAVIAIETAARKLDITTAALTRRLQAHNLIEGRLWKYYDLLHTQSSDYVATDLIETLQNRETAQ